MRLNKSDKVPIYLQLVKYVESGFNILDIAIKQRIITFIQNHQHDNGGYVDRAGVADLYYSLFGFWLSLATRDKSQREKFRAYINSQSANQLPGAVEQLALILIKTELFDAKNNSIISLLKTVFMKGKKIGLSYQFFLLTLAVDAQNRNKSLYYFFARIWLFFYKPKGNLPCSMMAALTFAKKTVGLTFEKEQQKLLSYYKEGAGFRAFDSVSTGDTLSTAVALFALRETGFDLRIIAPDCLDFIEQNYNDGAFLSGDGDATLDLEYTFYGLLALGTLIGNGE